ncbi:hypothetical protein H4W31_001201 [Plantactinospora soyae]|uniref:Uncharacterized protein n=1 Tax=Plantactinospora soyae TaxID=1544732 RepID=A0A927QXK2_9ACTN|nr:hypothetical protein [Plantactinospora soyae]
MPFGPYVRPMTETEYQEGMRASSPVPEVVRLDPIVPPPAATRWAREGGNGRDPLSGRHQIDRAGALTRAQTNRGRYGKPAPQDAKRAGRV